MDVSIPIYSKGQSLRFSVAEASIFFHFLFYFFPWAGKQYHNVSSNYHETAINNRSSIKENLNTGAFKYHALQNVSLFLHTASHETTTPIPAALKGQGVYTGPLPHLLGQRRLPAEGRVRDLQVSMAQEAHSLPFVKDKVNQFSRGKQHNVANQENSKKRIPS